MPKLIPPGRRGPYWYWRGTCPEGAFEYSTGETTRRRAEAWVEDYRRKQACRRLPGAGEPIAFDRAAEAYKAFANLSRQDARLVDRVAAWFGNKDCRALTHADLVDAANAMMAGLADSTKNRKVIGPAAAVLHYAAEQGWCDYRRIKKFWVSSKSTREPASDDVVALLLANVEAVRTNKRGRKRDYQLEAKRLLLVMLYETGLRLGHLLSLEWRHVQLAAGQIVVRVPKSDETASVPVSEVVVAMLGSRFPKTGRVFPWSTNRGVYGWLKPLTERLGVTYTPHMSRHRLATDADAAQIPDKKAALLGVWKDPRSLHRYQHVRPDAIPGRTAATLLGNGRGKGR